MVKWLLLLSEGLDKSTLADVKKQLIWQGFGALAPSLMASPSQKLADVQTLLHEAGVADNCDLILKRKYHWRFLAQHCVPE